MLNLTFKEFFEAFKFSKKDELVAENSELAEENARLKKTQQKICYRNNQKRGRKRKAKRRKE